MAHNCCPGEWVGDRAVGGVSWGTGPDTEPPPNPKPSGSDGLVKLWTIKNNECVKTLDAHEDKVWGLHCNRLDDYALTGASDSCVILWKVCGLGLGGNRVGRAAWGYQSDPRLTLGCDRD